MSPREALETDPGQRLALVTAYEALEMSGFVPNRTPSTQLDRIGTFNGQVSDEYKEQNMSQEVGTFFITGSMRAFASVRSTTLMLISMVPLLSSIVLQGRINHFFRFGGPAISLDTACSTSSVALHAACTSIWTEECETAVVGGMNIISSSDNYLGLDAGHFISQSGGCKTWDKDADGYCRGEAVASIIIKPLQAARADNDEVIGVILSSATNYSAKADSITRPHGPTQEKLYKTVLQNAGLQPFDVDYVEMHGTATQSGDVAEVGSVSNVFAPRARQRPADNPMYIGGLKANIGHGESASGVASLIKILLMFREQAVPPHIGIKTSINPKFSDLESRNMHIAKRMMPLPSKVARGSRRHILLNNFSAAGGNTACILEEPEIPSIDVDSTDTRVFHIIVASAKSTASLLQNCRNLATYLERHPRVSLSDLSYTTTARRIQHPLRKAFVSTSVAQLKEEIANFISLESPVRFSIPSNTFHICICFSGQGSFYADAGRELYQTCHQFRSDLVLYDNIVKSHGFAPLLSVIEGSSAIFSQVQIQLASVAVQMALFRLFQSLGIKPSLVIGHSLGEYPALYAAGALSASDTLYLVGGRASLLEKLCQPTTHAMLAVHAEQESIRQMISDSDLEIACVNGPCDTVLSGSTAICRIAETRLKAKGIACKMLRVPYGYHSSQMDLIIDEFDSMTKSVQIQELKIPIALPSTASVIPEKHEINASYIKDQSRNCVRFYEAILECKKQGMVDAESIWLEIGPGSKLLEMVKATLKQQCHVLPNIREGETAWTVIGRSLSLLYDRGLHVNWQQYHRDFESGQHLLHLPHYAWDEKEYWIPYRNARLPRKNDRSSFVHRGPMTPSVQRLISRDRVNDTVSLIFETEVLEANIHALISGHVMTGCDLCPAVSCSKAQENNPEIENGRS